MLWLVTSVCYLFVSPTLSNFYHDIHTLGVTFFSSEQLFLWNIHFKVNAEKMLNTYVVNSVVFSNTGY